MAREGRKLAKRVGEVGLAQRDAQVLVKLPYAVVGAWCRDRRQQLRAPVTRDVVDAPPFMLRMGVSTLKELLSGRGMEMEVLSIPRELLCPAPSIDLRTSTPEHPHYRPVTHLFEDMHLHYEVGAVWSKKRNRFEEVGRCQSSEAARRGELCAGTLSQLMTYPVPTTATLTGSCVVPLAMVEVTRKQRRELSKEKGASAWA